MKNTHHNTTGLSGEELKVKQEKAKGQNREVLDFFLARPAGYFSACQVWREIRKPHVLHPILLTSVRRSCSNLKSMGLLVKTPHKTVGHYKDTVGTYQLAKPPQAEQKEMF